MASGFEEVALRCADRFVDTGQLNELELRTVGSTLVARVIQAVDPEWVNDQARMILEDMAVSAGKTPG